MNSFIDRSISRPTMAVVRRVVPLIVLFATITATSARAAQNDCGQPISDGISPVATDCLAILQASVGAADCAYTCVCDTTGDSAVLATDSLACLKRAVGEDLRLACVCETPQLLGLAENADIVLPVRVQAAYNDDTMFFQISWEGDRGDSHDYVHFTDGAWRTEGSQRRDGQATLDEDPARGSTNANSTVQESRATFMLNDPTGPNAVPGFSQSGCFLTCHNNSIFMPEWDGVSDLTKYLTDDTPGSLDLWHHRLHRSNPVGASDDQYVTRVPEGSSSGGRLRDAGSGPWASNSIGGEGNPAFVFDPSTTEGLFAFLFDALYTDPLRVMRTAATVSETVGGAIPFADAVAAGYVPREGDTVPVRVLRLPTGSAGDITALGTRFEPSESSPLFGRWFANTQRLLDTGNTDDTALADGGSYDIAFAVHLDKNAGRDHYVSFSVTVGLGSAEADITAMKVEGSGREVLPDFDDTEVFPVTELNLFKPGITSYGFLVNEDVGKEYIDPRTDTAVDQNHAGAFSIINDNLGCRDCHTAASADTFNPVNAGGFDAGAMEVLAPQRGGVNHPTPIPPAIAE